MNKLEVKGTQNFLGFNIPVIEGGFGEGQKVILAKTVAEIHDVKLKHINELINKNVDEFEFGVDILDLKTTVDTADRSIFDDLGFSNRDISISKNIYLLSEQGYFALVMLMRTEKAKEIRKQLRREYFAMREVIKKKIERTREEELTLKIVSGKANALDVKEYKDIITLKSKLDGKELVFTCTQLVGKLSEFVPNINTTSFHEWLVYKGLGTYERVGNDRRKTFQPTDLFNIYVAGEGLAITRKQNGREKYSIEYTSSMLQRIIDCHLEDLSRFVDERTTKLISAC